MRIAKRDDITLEMLKEELEYDPVKGHFYRLKTFRSVRKGDLAGTYDASRNAVTIGVCGKYYYALRLAWFYMTGHYPQKGEEIDHIDHDRTNNSWDNLRLVTKAINSKNQPKYSNNTSGVQGISFRKDTNKWRARIMVDGKAINLGSFKSFDAAVVAREEALLTYGFHLNHGK